MKIIVIETINDLARSVWRTIYRHLISPILSVGATLLSTTRTYIILTRNVLVFSIPFMMFLVTTLVFTQVMRADFQKYIELLKVLVWPFTLLLALFFFRKVVTYLFFSMNEFNFFGSKGVLKSVADVIEERVELRLQNEKDETRRAEELKSKELALSAAEQSRVSAATKADDNLKLARELLESYRKLSTDYDSVKAELDSYRQREQLRIERMEKFRARNRVRRFHHNPDDDSRAEKSEVTIKEDLKGVAASVTDKSQN